MKKIKKLLLTLVLLALCVCCVVPFTACSDGWQEVQSITYTTISGTKTLTSKCVFEFKSETATRIEYDSASEDCKYDKFPGSSIEIDINRKSFIDKIDEKMGNVFFTYTYFYPNPPDYEDKIYSYTKHTYKSYTLKYVQIRFLDNDNIDIKYDGNTITVSPLYSNDQLSPYIITYFND